MGELRVRAAETEPRRAWHGGGWLAPAVALMNRLTYREKFLLLSVLFLAPLALVLSFLASELQERGEFTRKETLGTRYLQPLMTLFRHTGEARLLARDYAESVHGAEAALASKAAQIDADFSALAAVDREIGPLLKSSERFASLEKSWRVVKAEVTRPLAEDPDRYVVDFLGEIRALLSLVGDNLIIDPVFDLVQRHACRRDTGKLDPHFSSSNSSSLARQPPMGDDVGLKHCRTSAGPTSG